MSSWAFEFITTFFQHRHHLDIEEKVLRQLTSPSLRNSFSKVVSSEQDQKLEEQASASELTQESGSETSSSKIYPYIVRPKGNPYDSDGWPLVACILCRSKAKAYGYQLDATKEKYTHKTQCFDGPRENGSNSMIMYPQGS